MFDLFFELNFPKTPNFTIKFLEVLCPPHWILCVYTLLSCFPVAFPSFYHTLPPPNLCFPHYLGPCTSSPACRCHGDDSSCISRPELYGLRRWFGAGGIFFAACADIDRLWVFFHFQCERMWPVNIQKTFCLSASVLGCCASPQAGIRSHTMTRWLAQRLMGPPVCQLQLNGFRTLHMSSTCLCLNRLLITSTSNGLYSTCPMSSHKNKYTCYTHTSIQGLYVIAHCSSIISWKWWHSLCDLVVHH